MESLSAQVKVPCLVGFLKPPVASENAYKGHHFSRLEVLGGPSHSIDRLFTHISSGFYTGVEKN